MVERAGKHIIFNPDEVAEFELAEVVPVESALNTAVTFESVNRSLFRKANELSGSIKHEDVQKATKIREQAEKLGAMASSIRAVCTPEEILSAQLDLGTEIL